MAIIAKTLIDQIVVQFSYGGEHQVAKPGELEGAHFSEIEYLIDDRSNIVMGKTNNPRNGSPQPLDPDKLADVLGKDFAVLAAQLAENQTQLAALQAEVATRDTMIAGLSSNVADLTEALSNLKGPGFP